MPKELHEAHAALARWQSPAEFIECVEKWEAQTPSKVFLGRAGGFLREAWVLAKFIRQIAVERVRLADPSEQWPDGYLEIGAATKSLEITEVMEPARRRGDEIKNLGPEIQMDPVQNWVARAEAIPAALNAAIERKAQRRYGSPAMLLVYLNISEYGIRQMQTEQIIAEAKARHAPMFEQIVVLWKEKLY
jgi:hypothetical protein